MPAEGRPKFSAMRAKWLLGPGSLWPHQPGECQLPMRGQCYVSELKPEALFYLEIYNLMSG